MMTHVIRTWFLFVLLICQSVWSFSVPSSFLGFTNMLQPPVIVNDNVFPPQTVEMTENNRDAIALRRPIDTGSNRAPIQFKDCVPFLAVLGLATGSSLLSGELLPLFYTVEVEVLFLAVCSLVGAYQFNIPVKHEKQDIDRSWDVLWKNIFNSLPYSSEDFFCSWFFDVPFDRIRREDAIEFISWAMFSNTPECLSAQQSTEVESIVQQIERETTPKVLRNSISVAKMVPSLEIATRRFPPRALGEEPLRSMRHSIEPLRWVHKPFGLYLFLQLIVHTGYAKSSLLRKGNIFPPLIPLFVLSFYNFSLLISSKSYTLSLTLSSSYPYLLSYPFLFLLYNFSLLISSKSYTFHLTLFTSYRYYRFFIQQSRKIGVLGRQCQCQRGTIDVFSWSRRHF